jgi:hypothetical protein
MQVGPKAALSELRELISEAQEFQMALAWLIAYLLFEGLHALMQGKANFFETFFAFSEEYLSNSYLLCNDEAQQTVPKMLAVPPQ